VSDSGSVAMSIGAAGFEPAISCARGTRNARLSHVLKNERPAGIEPTHPPWQGSRLPLHHGRLSVTTKLSNSESTGPDSNRRHRITGAESWPLDDQCLLLSVGPEGLERSPPRLRAGNAAANTLILCVSCWRGGSWTHDLRLIRPPLSPLSYAPVVE
jgi:hypothetical protein